MVSESRSTRFAVPAVLLIFLGVVLCAAYRVAAGTERHSFSAGSTPPAAVRLTAGRTYDLDVRGGVAEIKRRGGDPAASLCYWSTGDASQRLLSVAVESTDTKATNQVGRFVAPVSGSIFINCKDWGAVFVDDADNSGGDIAGVFLLGAVVALTLGAVLGLSAARDAIERTTRLRAGGDDDEIEGTVDVGVGTAGLGAVGVGAVRVTTGPGTTVPGTTVPGTTLLAGSPNGEVADHDGDDVGE